MSPGLGGAVGLQGDAGVTAAADVGDVGEIDPAGIPAVAWIAPGLGGAVGLQGDAGVTAAADVGDVGEIDLDSAKIRIQRIKVIPIVCQNHGPGTPAAFFITPGHGGAVELPGGAGLTATADVGDVGEVDFVGFFMKVCVGGFVTYQIISHRESPSFWCVTPVVTV